MHNNHPQGGSQADIRRTANGAIDMDHYYCCARAERADFLRALFSCIVRCGWRAWGCIKARMAGRTARRELSALSTRELRDLGIACSDLDAIASGAYFNDMSRYPQSRARKL